MERVGVIAYCSWAEEQYGELGHLSNVGQLGGRGRVRKNFNISPTPTIHQYNKLTILSSFAAHIVHL